ncbi:peptidylprolyl isomerase [Lacisediminihabitans changchengi]|uniref:peptidylprolyl isomerase n=1 Tax=Lacisediminihabitans changchengi TaxID=2787634 RepID=UPI0027DAB882|nr:peptidylprolyl isomerase [Lacisediminihabitans changchengi]
MAPSRNAERDAREARDRLRRYNARQAVFGHQVTRRKRDNIIAIVGVVVVAALATVTQVLYFTAGPGYTPTSSPSASASPSASSSPSASPEGKNTGDVPAKTIAEDRDWSGELDLNSVKLGITLDGKVAPQATSAFISLAKKNFYTTTGKTCHRLTTGGLSVIQCGSVNGDGTGDPGFSFGPVENAPVDGVYPAGTIAMARGTDQYSNSSQFFIVYKDSTLDTSGGGYTVFGKVTSGLSDFISKIADAGVANGSTDGAPKVATSITRLTLN